jgi:hypothetical protein
MTASGRFPDEGDDGSSRCDDHAGMAVPRIRLRGGGGDVRVGPATALVGEMLAYCVDWSEDASDARDAYRHWLDASGREEVMWFSAYMAALEQEEFSARSYDQVAARVQRELLVLTHHPGAAG